VGAGAGAAGAGSLAAGAGAWSGAGAAAGAVGGADEALFSAGGVLLHPHNTRTPTKLSNNMRWIRVASTPSRLVLFRFLPPGLFMFLLTLGRVFDAKLGKRILTDPRQREPLEAGP
jgi:hypothetical protein